MKGRRPLYLRLLCLLLASMLVILDVCFIFRQKNAYSETENRALQTFPCLSISHFFSGTAARQWDDYVADQFPMRSAFIRLNSMKRLALGNIEANGIILAKDGYLVRRFAVPSETAYNDTRDAIAAFVRRHPDMLCTMLLIPSAVTMLSDKLPYGAAGNEENEYIDRMLSDMKAAHVSCVDIRGTLSGVDDQLYYRTDHHWTSEAALAAYRRYAAWTGLERPYRNYRHVVVSDAFSGTLTAGSGFLMNETDTLSVFLPSEGERLAYTVTYVEEAQRCASVYDTSALERLNQYEVFLGGNYAQVNIDTTSGSGRTLLLIKDSYANCFVPFLLPDFSRIVIIDPRFFTGDLEELVEIERFTDVLFLYNAAFLASDRALQADLKQEQN